MRRITEPAPAELLADVEPREVMYLAGGLALLVLGTGLIMTNDGLRRLIVSTVTRAVPDLEEPLKKGLAGLLPDVERYLKIRAM